MDQSIDMFPIRVRSLQGDFSPEHWALVDWGIWSRTLVGFEKGIGRQTVWTQGKPDETDPYGDIEGGEVVIVDAPAVNERIEESPEDPRRCYMLDERMHAPGGLSVEVRRALKAAYVRRYILECNYHREAGCSQDAFCERLEAGLRFVRRFI